MPDVWTAPDYTFTNLDLSAFGSPKIYHTFTGDLDDIIDTTNTNGVRPVIHSDYGIYGEMGKLTLTGKILTGM